MRQFVSINDCTTSFTSDTFFFGCIIHNIYDNEMVQAKKFISVFYNLTLHLVGQVRRQKSFRKKQPPFQ